MKAATFPNTFDILPPAAQMPTNAPGPTEAPNYSITHPLPHRNTQMPLGIPGFICHFLPLHFRCLPTLGSQSHALRAGHYSSFTDSWSLQPLQLTIPPPTPPPAGHPLPPVQAPQSSPTRELEPQDTLSKNQAQKEMGRSEGLQAGPPGCLLCNKGSSRELESP